MQGKVPVGVATVAGYGLTVTGFAAAVVAFVMGDRDEQTVGVIVAGAVAGLAFAITQIGRYVQAKAAIIYTPIEWPGADVEKAEGPVYASTSAPATSGALEGTTNIMYSPPRGESDSAGVFDPLPGELAGSEVTQPDLPDVGDGEQVKTDG